MRLDRLRGVGLFAGLNDGDLQRIGAGVEEQSIGAGELLFAEGERGDAAYVVVSGEVEVVKTVGQRESLLALRGAGHVIGEMALLLEEPRIASVRARTDATLLTIPKAALDALLDTSPSAAQSLFRTLLARLQDTHERQRRTERLAQLGTLTAGVAHELNNPAAAAVRAADRLLDALAVLPEAVAAVAAVRPDALAAIAEVTARPAPVPPVGMARSDAESLVEEWLDDHDVTDGWRLAPELVDAGIGPGELDKATEGLDAGAASATVRLLAALTVPHRLAGDISESTRRVSEIVGRLKSHAYLDRAAVQSVDVHQGIDDSLLLLGHTLREVTVIRDYGPDVPQITASGGELNQVWVNLLDNARYAVTAGGVADPTIRVVTRLAGSDVVVEVEDNGPGIPADIRDRVFDAFFTTKPPGQGTGQGLNLSYQIVVLDHHGELTVESRPGRTTFRVVLPVRPPESVTP